MKFEVPKIREISPGKLHLPKSSIFDYFRGFSKGYTSGTPIRNFLRIRSIDLLILLNFSRGTRELPQLFSVFTATWTKNVGNVYYVRCLVMRFQVAGGTTHGSSDLKRVSNSDLSVKVLANLQIRKSRA